MKTNESDAPTVLTPRILPGDHWHRKTNDNTCSRCRKPVSDDDVPLMIWSDDGEDMLILRTLFAWCLPKGMSKIALHRWGFQIGRLHVTWLALWTNKWGLWVEWD